MIGSNAQLTGFVVVVVVAAEVGDEDGDANRLLDDNAAVELSVVECCEWLYVMGASSIK